MPRPRPQRTDRLISAAAVARSLGIEVDTLLNWHAHRRGPAPAAGSGAQLAYSVGELEAWRDRLGELSRAR